MKTAIVAGALANKPGNGGAAWTRLSWALGLKRLGFEVWFVEQIEDHSLVDQSGAPSGLEESANLAWFRRVASAFGLGERAALIAVGGGMHGLTSAELNDLGAVAALLINISGNLKHPAVLEGSAHRIYLDLDPGYTQFWHAIGLLDPSFEHHDRYYTVGEAIGSPRCPVPTGGIDWQPARQPVVLDYWPVAAGGEADRFTTVASWRDPYGKVSHGGREYGLKVHAFRELIEFPRLVAQRCEIALDIDPADRADSESLRAHGWHLADPAVVACDPDRFRHYVQASGAEFSVAKGVYAETRCGWFSDRTVRYLASGKPALVQDTGSAVPAGEGLLTFTTLDQAVAAAAEIARDYAAHRAAARALAEEWFDSDVVLGRLVDEVGVAP